jgi:hypothetical protein
VSNLSKLRDEHAEIIGILRRLGRVILQPAPPPAAELFALRSELSSILIAHLKTEDWVLYPLLLASPNAKVAGTARAFSAEMGGLAKAYCAYAEKWGAGAIEQDWAGYCEDTRQLIATLTSRIFRENRELYPLLVAFDQTA